MTFSLPASLLLAGEYAILEENGLGIAISIDVRARFTLEPSSTWSFEGLWGAHQENINLDDSKSLLASAFHYLRQRYYSSLPQSYHIIADTSDFFDKKGRKKGYGSSAVVVAGLAAILEYLFSKKSTALKDIRRKAFLAAVDAHRFVQGHRGSGYDIATSLFGGWGLFKGGSVPSWQELPHLPLDPLFFYLGPQAVKTVDAIQAYRTYNNESTLLQAVRQNNKLVEEFLQKPSLSDGLYSFLKQTKEIGLTISRFIGVSAEADDQLKKLFAHQGFYKALGAGNETFLVLDPPLNKEKLPIEALPVMAEGFRCDF